MKYSSRYLLLLLFFSLHSLTFSYSFSISNLNKGDSRKLKIGYHNYFYLDLSQFEKDDYIYFKVKLEYGYFTSFSLPYEGFDDISYSNEPVLSHSQSSYSSSYGSYYSYPYYYSYAYYYEIKKPSTKYLFVSNPSITLDAYYGNAYISNEGGLSTAAIIGICVAVIVAIAIASVVTYFVRRARRASYISPPVAVYAPPVTPPPTYY
jgi:hypothetical protein